jgi:hypothetical protein
VEVGRIEAITVAGRTLAEVTMPRIGFIQPGAQQDNQVEQADADAERFAAILARNQAELDAQRRQFVNCATDL